MGLIGIGIILLILGLIFGAGILWVIGLICLVVGLILLVAHSASGPWYRRWY